MPLRGQKTPVSALSEILSGKLGLTKRAESIAEHLGLKSWNKDYFCATAAYTFARSERMKELAREELEQLKQFKPYQPIEEEVIDRIFDWYHFAIMELTKVESDLQPSEIAKRINISVHECEQAIRRLLKVGLLKKDGRHLIVANDGFSFGNGVPNRSLRKFPEGRLNKARRSVHNQTVEEDTSKPRLAFDTKQ